MAHFLSGGKSLFKNILSYALRDLWTIILHTEDVPLGSLCNVHSYFLFLTFIVFKCLNRIVYQIGKNLTQLPVFYAKLDLASSLSCIGEGNGNPLQARTLEWVAISFSNA